MTPSVQHLGHAGIKYVNVGVSLTMDPWFYPAFLKSWFPYPDNRHLLEEALDSDYIYISHAHEDHFDREFLKQVDPCRTTLIIPRFRSKYLEREILKLGFSPIVLGHGESTILPTGIKLTMLLDRSHKEDSALLVDCGDFRFLNSNDCELAIPDWPKGVDLLACQFSGAFWYPHCYDFAPEVMRRKTAEVRDANMRRMFRRVELTEARAYLPSAGPPAFLDPALARFNGFDTIFPAWPDVAGWFSHKFPQVAVAPYLDTYDVIDYYAVYRRSEWASWYSESDTCVTEDEINLHFRKLQQSNKRFLGDWHKDILVTDDRQSWQVKLGLLTGELEETFDPSYFLQMPPRVLRAVIDGRATWETALASNRISLSRKPDVYDFKLMGMLNFGDRPIQTTTIVKQQATDEFIVKDGYEFQRWCPHAGEDLSEVPVRDGKIVCPRHEWSWDANTGMCLSGGDVPLRVKKESDE